VGEGTFMDLAEMARRIRAGDKGELDSFKRLLAAENDLGALKKIAAANWQEDEISIPVYERILEINPNDDEALGSLGLVKYLIGGDTEAAQCLEKARKINPEGLEVLTLQAALEKRPDEKLKIYRKMLELDPTNRVALHNLARLQKEQ
jgi:tetratricopeptide (TPR) repeat protein